MKQLQIQVVMDFRWKCFTINFWRNSGYTEDCGTNNPNSLFIGTYNYLVTDTNGCIYNNSVTITEPSEIIINVDSIVDVDVYNGNNGKILSLLTEVHQTIHISGTDQMDIFQIAKIF